MTTKQLTVLLPTLNEAGNIEPLTTRIWQANPAAEIIVIDDGSKDGTQDKVRDLIKLGKPIRLIARTGVPCLTDSISEGIESVTTPYCAWMDADLSHPPELLNPLLAAAKESGCAIATRFAKGGSYKKNVRDTPDSFAATLLSVVMNFLVKKWLRLEVTDYTSGFIVVRRNLLAGHPLVGDYGEYFIELMYFLSKSGVHIQEIPYSSPPREWGESKTGATWRLLMKRGIKYLWLAFRLRLPIKIFGSLNPSHPQKKRI